MRKIQKRMPGRSPGRNPAQAVAMGSNGYGGGPLWTDEARSRRAPTPAELVNAYRSLVYACVRLNAQGVARVPLRLYCKTGPKDRAPRRTVRGIVRPRENYLRNLGHLRAIVGGGDDLKEICEHPFLEALKKPNPYFDGHQFLLYLASCLDVIGTAFFFPVRPDPSYAASEWWPLHAQFVLPVKGTAGEIISGFTYFSESFTPAELIRLRHISLRDPYLGGYGPLQAMYEQAGLGNLYFGTVETILKGGAQLGLVGSPKDAKLTPNDDMRRRHQADLNNQLTGGGKGRILLTNGAYNFTQYTMPAEDLSGLEISKETRLYVANGFDVPISMLTTETSNRAVAEAGNYQHQRNAIEPRCWMIASALTAMAQTVDPRLFFAFDNPVEDDEERRAKIFDMKLKNGSMAINEARAEDGFDPKPWGDEPWLSNTLIQPSAAAEAREQAQAQTQAEAAAAKPAPEADDPVAEDDSEQAPAKPARAIPDRRARSAETPADDATTALLSRLTIVLEKIEADLEPDPDPLDPGDEPAGLGSAPGTGREAAQEAQEGGSDPTAGGEAQHVWAADGGDDQPQPEAVLPAAEGQGAGGPAAG